MDGSRTMRFGRDQRSAALSTRLARSLMVLSTYLVACSTPVQCAGFALSFDGADDYVSLPPTQDLQLVQTDFTIEVWLYSGSFNPDSRIISGVTPGTAAYQLQIAGGRVTCDLTTQPYTNINFASAAILTPNSWHHLAMVRQSTTIQLLIDGVLDSSGSNSGATYQGTVGEIRLGRRQGGCCPFPGILDEMRIWNRARTVSEIQTDMHRALTGTESGLVAYWRFDEGAGQVASDSTGRGNAGQLGDASSADSADPIWTPSGAPLGDQTPSSDSWLQLAPVATPPGRIWSGMVFDEARNRLVLFGGAVDYSRSASLNDTWEWDGSAWTEVATPTDPPVRHDLYLAYDSNRQKTVLYGGSSGFGSGSS